MSFTNQHRKQLQRLIQDKAWEGLEAFLEDFMMRNFAVDSIKRDSEFNTMWYAAEKEGAKSHLLRFFREVEEEASKVETS